MIFRTLLGLSVSPWVRAVRHLFYGGEWMQSHSLHIHLLATPDYLGFNSVIDMVQQYSDEVRRGLKLQTLDNDLVALFGARSVHPVGPKIGGFFRAPDKKGLSLFKLDRPGVGLVESIEPYDHVLID